VPETGVNSRRRRAGGFPHRPALHRRQRPRRRHRSLYCASRRPLRLALLCVQQRGPAAAGAPTGRRVRRPHRNKCFRARRLGAAEATAPSSGPSCHPRRRGSVSAQRWRRAAAAAACPRACRPRGHEAGNARKRSPTAAAPAARRFARTQRRARAGAGRRGPAADTPIGGWFRRGWRRVLLSMRHLRGGRLDRGPPLCWAGPRIHAVGVGAPFARAPAGGARGPPLWLGGPRTLFGLPLDSRPRCKPESATFGESRWNAARPSAGQGRVSTPSAWAPLSRGRPPAAREGRLFG